MSPSRVSRRDLLSAGAAIGSALVVTSPAEAKSITGEMPWSPGVADAPKPVEPGSYHFFSSDEAAFIEAAIARLIPNDDLGPGAKEAGVAIFLDRQLGGAYGHAVTWYMRGPWPEGSKSQGYQTRLTPAQLYRAAIKAIDAHCRQTFSGKSFAQLEAKQQDDVLSGLETGKIKLQGAEATLFFDTFLQNTIEGFFADPIYGGNRDMAAWKMIGFPGTRYNYLDWIDHHNQPFPLPPVSLQGRAEWTVRQG
jgi:gluconate 2-dehydrogenase gamma chain